MLLNFESFIAWLLSALANFLLAEPIIYIVGLFMVAYLVKIFKLLIS